MSTPRSRRAAPRLSSGHSIHAQRRGFTAKRTSYAAPGDGTEFDPYLVADLALTKKVAETLERHYPAHPWMVKVTHAQGIVMIKLPILMKRNEEHVLHIDRLACDPGLRAVIRAGGEILERHNVSRQPFRLDQFLDARAKTPAGRPRPRLITGNEPSAGPRPRLIMPDAMALR